MNYFDVHNIFPEYLVISIPLFDDVIHGEIDEWLYVMKNSRVKEDFKSPYMKKVAERLNILKMTKTERTAYQSYINKSLKDRDYIVSAKEEGEEIGIKKGKIDGKIEVAKKMLESKLPLEIISQCSGLTIDEIKKLL